MNIDKLIALCKERNELDFLFEITKSIAEADSIGEEYGYCRNYTKEQFNNAEIFEGGYCDYIIYGSLPIYELYLKHINK